MPIIEQIRWYNFHWNRFYIFKSYGIPTIRIAEMAVHVAQIE